MGSLLTGLHPFEHGLSPEGNQLPDSVQTFPELFRACGYRTAAASANMFFSPATGLDRGFDTFEWIRPSPTSLLKNLGPRLLGRWLWNINEHSAGLTLDTKKHSSAYLLNQIAKREFERLQSSESPVFLCLHFVEPHTPYHPPRPYLDRFTDDLSLSVSEVADRVLQIHDDRYELTARGCPLSEEDYEALRAMYDAEIAYMDSLVSDLYEHCVSESDREVLLVVTSDHGDLHGEYDSLFHAHLLVEELTRVPVLWIGGDPVDANRSQHADILTTLYRRIGGELDGVRGIDLDSEQRRFVVTQRPYRDEFTKEQNYVSGFSHPLAHVEPVTAVSDGRFKFKTSDDREILCRLPDESEDVGDDEPDKRQELSQRADAILERCNETVQTTPDAVFTSDMENQLRDLGYL